MISSFSIPMVQLIGMGVLNLICSVLSYTNSCDHRLKDDVRLQRKKETRKRGSSFLGTCKRALTLAITGGGYVAMIGNKIGNVRDLP